jgi:hypothetical protein
MFGALRTTKGFQILMFGIPIRWNDHHIWIIYTYLLCAYIYIYIYVYMLIIYQLNQPQIWTSTQQIWRPATPPIPTPRFSGCSSTSPWASFAAWLAASGWNATVTPQGAWSAGDCGRANPRLGRLGRLGRAVLRVGLLQCGAPKRDKLVYNPI